MKVPQHIAIIMDGNRRWAKKHHLTILKGHEYASDKVLEKIIKHASKLGVKYLTFWAFSTENWQRNKAEVEGLMQIFRRALKEKVRLFIENNVRLLVIGDITKLPFDIQAGIEEAIEKTKTKTAITVVFAMNYGGRDEINRAINKLLENSKFNPPLGGQNLKLSENELSNYVDTANIPDPDLIIRTGGEKRLSGFLLWQSEYSELYFVDTLWPDFTESDLDLAISDYNLRRRRFGK